MSPIGGAAKRRSVKAARVVAYGLALLSAGCHTSQSGAPPTSPSTSAAPAVTETFVDTLPVGGNKFYSFSIATAGTVNVTLVSVSGDGVPPDVSVNLGIGSPSGVICSSTNQSTVQAGSTPQVTATEQPGVYCVNIQDAGPNLPAPAVFTITIAHP